MRNREFEETVIENIAEVFDRMPAALYVAFPGTAFGRMVASDLPVVFAPDGNLIYLHQSA